MHKSPQDKVDYFKRLITLRKRTPSQTVDDFCSQHSISTCAYYYWRKRFINSQTLIPHKSDSSPSQAFIPVTIPSPPVSAEGFEISFPNGIRLRTMQPLDGVIVSVLATVKVGRP